jgi:hypothetical protein
MPSRGTAVGERGNDTHVRARVGSAETTLLRVSAKLFLPLLVNSYDELRLRSSWIFSSH